MAMYSVFEPPARKARTPEQRVERITFVKDGFAWGALLWNVLWMVFHRLWLVLVLYLAVVTLVFVGLAVADAPDSLVAAVAVGFALLLGLEGTALRRWTLRRRGWREAAVVAAPSREEAERRFFQGWEPDPRPRPAPPPPDAGLRRPADPGVIGFGAAS